ncbi:MAG: hypothetical protein LBK25_05705 [Treponema sp.]|nr:hypothetical protein [Treponema sp.]
MSNEQRKTGGGGRVSDAASFGAVSVIGGLGALPFNITRRFCVLTSLPFGCLTPPFNTSRIHHLLASLPFGCLTPPFNTTRIHRLFTSLPFGCLTPPFNTSISLCVLTSVAVLTVSAAFPFVQRRGSACLQA